MLYFLFLFPPHSSFIKKNIRIKRSFPLSPFGRSKNRRKKGIIACVALRTRPAAPDARGTSSNLTSESVRPLVQVKPSASLPPMMLMVKIAPRCEVGSSILIGVAEGEAERVISVETGAVEEAEGSGDEAPPASLPFVLLQLQLVRPCIGYGPSLIGSYYHR